MAIAEAFGISSVVRDPRQEILPCSWKSWPGRKFCPRTRVWHRPFLEELARTFTRLMRAPVFGVGIFSCLFPSSEKSLEMASSLGEIEMSTKFDVHKIWVPKPPRDRLGEQREVWRIFLDNFNRFPAYHPCPWGGGWRSKFCGHLDFADFRSKVRLRETLCQSQVG